MNIELEPTIISSLIEYPQLVDDFTRIIKPYHVSKDYQNIYATLIKLKNNNEVIEPAKILLNLSSEIDKNLFTSRVLSANPSTNVFNYIGEIQNRYKIQEQTRIAGMLSQKASEGEVVEVDEILSYIKDAPTNFKTFHGWAEDVDNMPVLPKYETGISFLDRALDGGFNMAQLVLLSGEPEAGKTSMGVQILENVSYGFKTAFFCFEFTARQYITTKLKSCPSFRENENMYIINDGYDIGTVADRIRALAKMGVKFILIDSQMRIDVFKARSMEEEESEKFSTLAKLAHSLEILIILIVQTSKTDSNNPMGSKKGGHESSITIRIEHVKSKSGEQREFDPSKRVIIIKKNKQTGKHFKEEVAFDINTRRFKMMYQTRQPSQTADFKDG
ncbi:ATPase domain-containing protein [Campylobacter hyointestinalis]|uniref:ATPase domain-containing protein n=1 Tax=Campylobacter hyointestinalis TaxID=198 RepID=UPI00072B5D69|nr:ATPase domain-containing protein [Campylobacter hyointestinalis]CUU82548.1 type II secretion system protein [Campylobacter hyointestinalis subsp. hyointestinalis]